MEAAAAEAASQEARRLVLARDAAEGGAAALLEQLQAAHGEGARLEARVAQLESAAAVAAEEVQHYKAEYDEAVAHAHALQAQLDGLQTEHATLQQEHATLQHEHAELTEAAEGVKQERSP